MYNKCIKPIFVSYKNGKQQKIMKKQITSEKLAEGLNACVELSLQMLQAGTLLKNVKAHWLNNGFNTELTDSIVKKAENIFNTEYSHYRAK